VISPNATTPNDLVSNHSAQYYKDKDNESNAATTTTKFPGTQATEQTKSASMTIRNLVMVNDGTLRVTVKWKPGLYKSLEEDATALQDATIHMLQDVLHYPNMSILLAPWSSNIHNTSTLTMLSNNLSTNSIAIYQSPNLTQIDAYKMFVCGIQISAT
jgi:hypothetical protein